MGRLTIPEIDYSQIGVVENLRTAPIAAMLCRLAQYEDTGLSPEEIKLNMDGLGEYRKAEALGRLVVLPCKDGDTVYVINKKRAINKYKISGFMIDTNHIWVDTQEFDSIYGAGIIDSSLFGIDVFFTREEAEKALEAQK